MFGEGPNYVALQDHVFLSLVLISPFFVEMFLSLSVWHLVTSMGSDISVQQIAVTLRHLQQS
jgi:hypothetical protein